MIRTSPDLVHEASSSLQQALENNQTEQHCLAEGAFPPGDAFVRAVSADWARLNLTRAEDIYTRVQKSLALDRECERRKLAQDQRATSLAQTYARVSRAQDDAAMAEAALVNNASTLWMAEAELRDTALQAQRARHQKRAAAEYACLLACHNDPRRGVIPTGAGDPLAPPKPPVASAQHSMAAANLSAWLENRRALWLDCDDIDQLQDALVEDCRVGRESGTGLSGPAEGTFARLLAAVLHTRRRQVLDAPLQKILTMSTSLRRVLFLPLRKDTRPCKRSYALTGGRSLAHALHLGDEDIVFIKPSFERGGGARLYVAKSSFGTTCVVKEVQRMGPSAKKVKADRPPATHDLDLTRELRLTTAVGDSACRPRFALATETKCYIGLPLLAGDAANLHLTAVAKLRNTCDHASFAASKHDVTLHMLWAAARSLLQIHAAGVVHNDVRLRNLFCTTTGHLFVSDFGLAFAPEDAPVGPNLYVASPEYARALGSPPMVGKESDMYSFGLMVLDAFGANPLEGSFGERGFEELPAEEIVETYNVITRSREQGWTPARLAPLWHKELAAAWRRIRHVDEGGGLLQRLVSDLLTDEPSGRPSGEITATALQRILDALPQDRREAASAAWRKAASTRSHRLALFEQAAVQDLQALRALGIIANPLHEEDDYAG